MANTDPSMTNRLESYWALVQEIWQDGLYGVDIGQILTAIAIFLVCLLIRGLVTRFVLARIAALAARTETTFDDAVVRSLEAPIRFIPIAVGFFLATSYLDLSGDAADFVGTVDRTLIAFTIFWALHRAAHPVSDILRMADNILTGPMIDWLEKAIKIAFIVIGAATILELWGIQVGPLVAGLGLFGVAVALGAQDLFKNLIAGLFLISERRFHPGDWILVDGVVEGTVERIGFRTTIVRRFDKAPVYVPNSVLSDQSVTNFSRMTLRRIKWVIGIRYDANADQLTLIRDGILDYLSKNPDFAQPEETATFVRIDSFGASSVDILLYAFTRTTNWLEWLEKKEALLLEIKRIVEAAGTDFAFPSQSVYIEAMGDAGDMQGSPLKELTT